MRVLVTGGAGFIGSNLVHALVGAGHEVGVIDDMSTGKFDNLHPYAWTRTLDILDPSLPQVVGEFAPDAVVHLAAQASVTVSLEDPERDWAVNAEGTRLVAQAARDAGARRVVSASSAAVYGEPVESDLPLTETAPKGPANPYGRSKLAAETLLHDALSGSDTDWASFRFANVYGPRQDGAGEGGVVAIFCEHVHKKLPLEIYGTGEQTRDFIFVGDVVAAIMQAIASDEVLGGELGDGSAYNISTGLETSVNDLLGAVRMASSFPGMAANLPARKGDVMRSSLSPAKAAERFGWNAHQELTAGIDMTWRWYAAQA
jgi:UDP-glucose 4-epimerase